MATPEEIAAANEDGDFKAKMTRMYNEWELAKSNLLEITLLLSGTLEFGGGVGRLWKEGASFLAVDSGDALASIPTGAGLNWFKDKFVGGTQLGEIAGGFSTPGALTFHNMVMRAMANADGANAKIGVWDASTGDWLRAWTVQDSAVAGDVVALIATSGGQATTTSYAIFTFTSTTDGFLSLLRGGSQKQVLVTGDAGTAITNQTGTYSAVAGDFVRCSGTFTVTLPSAPANNSEVWVKNAGTGTITVARGGSDTMFVFTSGLTTVTLAPGEALGFKYYATGTEWSVF